jgi:hypothetical protein
MINYVWVVEYNAFPKLDGTSWSPIICDTGWDKKSAKREIKNRAWQTGNTRNHYRVVKYITT